MKWVSTSHKKLVALLRFPIGLGRYERSYCLKLPDFVELKEGIYKLLNNLRGKVASNYLLTHLGKRPHEKLFFLFVVTASIS